MSSSGGLNPLLYNNLLSQQLQGINVGGSTLASLNNGGLSINGAQGNNASSSNNGQFNFDLLNLQQMQMGGLPQNYSLPMMQMPFIPPLYNQTSSSSMGGLMSGHVGGGGGGHGSAASFHQPTEKNQVKLFVGGLAFSTSEDHLLSYFQSFGKVENTIVMREKLT